MRVRVPEVSFLNRSGPIPLSEILNTKTFFFKAFTLCKVALTVAFLGGCQYFGYWLLLYVGCSALVKPLHECLCALQLQGKAPAGLLLLHSPLWKCPMATWDISHGCAALYCHVTVLVTTAHTSPCHGFGKVSPIGTWDSNRCCCGPVQPCLRGLSRGWGSKRQQCRRLHQDSRTSP